MKKRLLPLIAIFLVYFSFVSYAFTTLDDKTVQVPDDEKLYTTIADINKDIFTYKDEHLWMPLNRQINTLVYHMENHPETLTDMPYVTVLTAPTGEGITCSGNLSLSRKVPVIYLSDNPLILINNTKGNVPGLGAVFGNGRVYTLHPVISGSMIVWRLDMGTGGSVIELARDIYGDVTDFYNLQFANYDIESYTLTSSTSGAVITKGLSKNYEKYGDKLHGGGGVGFPELDKDVPSPKNLKGTFDRKTGQIKLTWSPVDDYSCRIVGYAEMIAQPVLGSESTFYSSKVFHSSELDVFAGYPSNSGNFLTNLSNFVFDVGSNENDYKRKTFRPTRFTVQFYTYVDGVMKAGGVSSVRFNVDDGTVITEETDIDGNVTDGGKYDENGNVIIDGSSGSTGSSFQDIIKDLMNIPSIFTGFFTILKGLFTELSVVPELIAALFAFLPDSLIVMIGSGIAVVVVLRILGR